MTNPFTQPAGAKPAHMKLPAPWHDTLDYYQKSWTDRATPPRPSITGRTAYKSYVSSYTQQNSQEIPGFNGLGHYIVYYQWGGYSGCIDYEQLWMTSSLRGIATMNVEVKLAM